MPDDKIFLTQLKKPDGMGCFSYHEGADGNVEVYWIPRTKLSFYEQDQLAKEQAQATAIDAGMVI